MRATSLLHKQHCRMQAFLTRLEDAPNSPEVASRVAELAIHLAGHLVIEEELFHPAVGEEIAVKAAKEHEVAKFALMSLLGTRLDDETFQEKVTALKEIVEQHATAHEKAIFPKVERKMEKEKLEELGLQMRSHFHDVVESGYQAALIRSMSH
jgi:hypothetical protein